MILRCPKCLKPLTKKGNMFLCQDNHCYDIASQGYVNLVLANQKHSLDPGDNSESLQARRDFLNNDYYLPLANKLSQLINKYIKGSFLDAGTGTGYYLRKCIDNCSNDVSFYGCDLAKKGVAMASKSCPEAILFVGNVFHLPIQDTSLNGLMSVFTPYSSQEFNRIIKKDGYVISVSPGKNHLLELKQIVYDNPYLNLEEGYKLDGFKLIEKSNVTYTMHLKENKDVLTLWRMTPYYHTTSKENNEKLNNISSMDCLADFLVCVYEKI